MTKLSINFGCEETIDSWVLGNFLDEEVEELAKAVAHGQNVGLNGDWSVSAWHLGPSSVPNKNDGDFYLLDNEDNSYSVVQRFYREPNDEIKELLHLGGFWASWFWAALLKEQESA